MDASIHRFDNGLRVKRAHLSEGQRLRYARHNVHEVHEEALFQRLLHEAPPGATFLSVGMGIGYYVLLARLGRPDLVIHAVEPLARHRAWFRENAALNGVDPDTITVHAEALGPREGSAPFEDHGCASVVLVGDQRRGVGFWARHGTQRMMRSLGLGAAPRRIARVPLITLSTMLSRVTGDVALMQMDIQGVEGDVLEASVAALREGRVRHALVGTHGRDVHSRSRAALESAGFTIEVDQPEPRDQPDGMILARRTQGSSLEGAQRLGTRHTTSARSS